MVLPTWGIILVLPTWGMILVLPTWGIILVLWPTVRLVRSICMRVSGVSPATFSVSKGLARKVCERRATE